MFDRTQEPSPDLNKKETSRSNKTEKVCWVATGDFGKKATVSETFKTQAQSGKRRNLLAYLKSKDVERYRALIEKLGLRK